MLPNTRRGAVTRLPRPVHLSALPCFVL